MARIYSEGALKEKPTLNLDRVRRFFEERARKAEVLGYKSAVMYQDKNPGLVEARDLAEKHLLIPKLDLNESDRFLDVGCGTGRWAEAVISRVAQYHGTDFAEGLVQIAKSRGFPSNARFSCVPCTELSLEKLRETEPFDKLICFGLMMYLNDSDVKNFLQAVLSVSARKSLFLVREPVALDRRLTLSDHYSEDMGQQYNAIYRTEQELLAFCNDELGQGGYALVDSGDVFSDPRYNNRAETKQKFFLFQRREK